MVLISYEEKDKYIGLSKMDSMRKVTEYPMQEKVSQD